MNKSLDFGTESASEQSGISVISIAEEMRTVFIINGKEQRRAGDILHDRKQPVILSDGVNFS